MNFQAISVKEVEDLLRRYDTRLIDLRTREEYERSHIEGAQNMPYDDIERYKNYLSKEKRYILYCERGSTSILAAKALSREGYHVYTVIGGLRALEKT